MDVLTTAVFAPIVEAHRSIGDRRTEGMAMAFKPIALFAAGSGGAVVLATVPGWCVVTVVLIAAALAALRVVVTQIIRLRASSKITSSAHALRLLTHQDDRPARER